MAFEQGAKFEIFHNGERLDFTPSSGSVKYFFADSHEVLDNGCELSATVTPRPKPERATLNSLTMWWRKKDALADIRRGISNSVAWSTFGGVWSTLFTS